MSLDSPSSAESHTAPVRGRKRTKASRSAPDGASCISVEAQDLEYVPVLITNEISFIAWIDQATAGDILEYYRGYLAFDLEKTCTRLCEEDRVELVKLAACAMFAADLGRVHLVQRRNAPNDFSYLAVVRPKPPRAASLSSLLLEEAA